MKKTVSIVTILTCVAVLYVFQHTKLLEYSYNIHSGKKALSLLIDRNRALSYNISRLESPSRLEEAVLVRENANQAYVAVDCYKIRLEDKSLTGIKETSVPQGFFADAGRMFLSMFSLNTEAVAKEPGE
jgi:hypothetical protein